MKERTEEFPQKNKEDVNNQIYEFLTYPQNVTSMEGIVILFYLKIIALRI